MLLPVVLSSFLVSIISPVPQKNRTFFHKHISRYQTSYLARLTVPAIIRQRGSNPIVWRLPVTVTCAGVKRFLSFCTNRKYNTIDERSANWNLQKGNKLMNTTKRHYIICYGSTICIFLIIALWGMFGSIDGDALGYSILNFYLIMPLTSMINGLILGIKNIYLKWMFPVLFGILGFLIPRFVFGSWDGIALIFSFIPALLGVSAGTLISKVRKK